MVNLGKIYEKPEVIMLKVLAVTMRSTLLIILCTFIAHLTPIAYASSPQNEASFFYGALRGKASFVDSSRVFQLGNTGNFTTGTIDSLIHMDTDKWGGGYEAVIGTSFFAPVTLEASFEQSFTSMSASKHNLPGIGAQAVSVMPFINNDFGTTQFGFYLSQHPNVGQSASGDYTFKYSMDYYCIRLGLSAVAYATEMLSIDLIAGPVYANLTRRYKVLTKGTNPGVAFGSATSITTSNTSEQLICDFWGGELGMKGTVHLTDKCTLSAKGTADLFVCNSKFEATQWISNGFNLDLGTFSTTLQVDDWHTNFVPHLTSNVNLTYDVTNDLAISLYYQFDTWLEMPYISNPRVTGNLTSSSGRSSIKTGERIFSHVIGGSLILEF